MLRFIVAAVTILILANSASADTFTDNTAALFRQGFYVDVNSSLKTNISAGNYVFISNPSGGIEPSGAYWSRAFKNTTTANSMETLSWKNISWSGMLYNTTARTDISDYDSGLVGYWKFNNDSAYGESDTLVYDYSGNGHNGTPAGGAAFNSSGYFNGSYSFDGVNDYITLGLNGLGDVGGTNFTIEAWVKTTDTTAEILSEYQGGVCGDFIFGIRNTGELYVHDGAGPTNNGDTSITDGNWHHVAYVYGGTSGYTYVDGVQGADTTAVQWRNTCNVDVEIGDRADGGAPLAGTIDSLRVYNHTLTASEIAIQYAAGRGLKTSMRYRTSNTTQEVYNTSGLVSFWKFNNDSAFGENSTNIYDYSGNGHNGTPSSGAAFNASGYFNGSYYFDQTGPITVPNSADFDFGSGNFTVEWWENRPSGDLGSTPIVRDGREAITPFLFGFYAAGPDTQVYIANNDCSGWDITGLTLGTLTLNTWNYYAVTRAGNDFYTYKNGVQQATTPSSVSMCVGNGDLKLGQYQTGLPYYYKGKLDSMRIYKGRALSAAEIKYNYQHADFSGSSWSGYFVNSPATLSQPGKYLQYEALLETNDTCCTPLLEGVTTSADVAPTASISFVSSSVPFQNMSINQEDNTTDWSPIPFVLQNDGNTNVNATVSATNLWASAAAANPSGYYQFKSEENETGSVGSSSDLVTSWTNMTITQTKAATNLKPDSNNNAINVHIKIVVPPDEPVGVKSSTVTFTVSQA